MIAATTKRYLLSLAAIFVGMIMRKNMYKFEDDSDILLKQKYGSETYDIITSHVIDELILDEKLQYSESETEVLGYIDLHDLVQDDDADIIVFDVETGDFIGDDDYVRENPHRQAKLRGYWK